MPDLPELPPDYIPRGKRRVILESPYGGDDVEAVIISVRYASACIKDALSRGEAPLAGHVLYAQNGVLDKRTPEDVDLGIDAALTWAECAEGTIVYTDRGVTREMRLGIDHARACERNIETRKLGGDWGLCGYPIGLKDHPWEEPNDHGEHPGEICCQRATGERCHDHDRRNYSDAQRGDCGLPAGHEGDHE